MRRRWVFVAALLLTAWTMGLEFAHVLEWQPKSSYPGPLYVRLQESLYVWFGNVGGVIYVLAVVAGVRLAILLRRERAVRGRLAAAAALQVIALAVFLTVVYPVNFRFPVGGTGAVPTGWEASRHRWELGHSLGFALFTAAFILLSSVVRLHAEPGSAPRAAEAAPPTAQPPGTTRRSTDERDRPDP